MKSNGRREGFFFTVHLSCHNMAFEFSTIIIFIIIRDFNPTSPFFLSIRPLILQFCRQFAAEALVQTIYIIVVFPRTWESLYTFFWQHDPYKFVHAGFPVRFFFNAPNPKASFFNVKCKPISLKRVNTWTWPLHVRVFQLYFLFRILHVFFF